MIGIRPMKAAATRHQLRRTRHRAVHDRSSSSASEREVPSPRVVVGEVEEQQHEDAGLGVEPHERDHPDPGRDRDVGKSSRYMSQTALTTENGTASITIDAFTPDFVFM